MTKQMGYCERHDSLFDRENGEVCTHCNPETANHGEIDPDTGVGNANAGVSTRSLHCSVHDAVFAEGETCAQCQQPDSTSVAYHEAIVALKQEKVGVQVKILTALEDDLKLALKNLADAEAKAVQP